MANNLEKRIERLNELAGPSISENDLPDGFVDPGVFYEHPDGEWDHEKQMELMLSKRGPEHVADFALNEFNDIEHNVDVLERQFLKLFQATSGERTLESHELDAIKRTAKSIGNGDGFVDSSSISMCDSVKTALVVLGEMGEVEGASSTVNSDE